MPSLRAGDLSLDSSGGRPGRADRLGIAGVMLDASTPFEGQIVYANGAETARMTLELPPAVPFEFVGLPQYETEQLLAGHLARLGGRVELFDRKT